MILASTPEKRWEHRNVELLTSVIIFHLESALSQKEGKKLLIKHFISVDPSA